MLLLCYSRTFVICGNDGRFLSQRAHPKMAIVRPRFIYGNNGDISFALSAPGMDDIIVQVPPDRVEPTHSIK